MASLEWSGKARNGRRIAGLRPRPQRCPCYIESWTLATIAWPLALFIGDSVIFA
jgi:hypothetical protein